MLALDQMQTYVVATTPGFNSEMFGIVFRDGVGGPVSAELATRVTASMASKAFPFDPAKQVRWVRRGDIWEAFYEAPERKPTRRRKAKGS